MFMSCDRLARNFSRIETSLQVIILWLISEPDFVSWLNGFVNFVYFPWALQRRLSCHWAFSSPCNVAQLRLNSCFLAFPPSCYNLHATFFPILSASLRQIQGLSMITTIGPGPLLVSWPRPLPDSFITSHHIFHLFTYILFSKTT